jgi:Na+/H+ antiporter NhaD/arsenite permease-like protein
MDPTVIIFILIFLLILLVSATALTPLSVAALGGAVLTAWFGIEYEVFTYEEALTFVDARVLVLLIGTMIVVEIAKRSGLFRVLALYAIRFSGGDPTKLFVAICMVSAAVSMFLNDQMSILLMAAATVTVTKLLRYNPIPYLLSATVMINVGGTSTLIGSASNMIIGIEANISFSSFIYYLTSFEIILWALTLLILYLVFKSKLGKRRTLPEYKPLESIATKRLFYGSIFILFLMIFLFLTLENLGVGPEGVALGCAILALILSKLEPAEVFKELDWETVFFIAGFMFIVGGLEKTGILNNLSTWLIQVAGGSPSNAAIMILWFSGIASTMVSNVAIALTFLPIITSQTISGLNSPAVWSALVLGTNLGGATTPFSGSVCMMAIGTLKREGISVGFTDFARVGLMTTILQLGFSSLFLFVRFGMIGL